MLRKRISQAAMIVIHFYYKPGRRNIKVTAMELVSIVLLMKSIDYVNNTYQHTEIDQLGGQKSSGVIESFDKCCHKT